MRALHTRAPVRILRIPRDIDTDIDYGTDTIPPDSDAGTDFLVLAKFEKCLPKISFSLFEKSTKVIETVTKYEANSFSNSIKKK